MARTTSQQPSLPLDLDVLTSTGSRSVGWMAMYGLFVTRKFNSPFDIGFSFSGVGGVKCLDRIWSSSGPTRTVPSPYPSAPAPVMSCLPSTPALHVSPPFRTLRVMYEAHLSVVTMPNLISSLLHVPGDSFQAKVCIHHARQSTRFCLSYR